MVTNDSGLILAKTGARGLSGHVPKVKEYLAFSDKALDGEIVDSVNEAHAHYNGLRRELVLRLLPALGEMRRRYSAQGTRNDLQVKLGLPKRAGWEDYLHSRGLRPDTVRNWFSKYTAAKTLRLLVSGNQGKTGRLQSPSPGKGQPRLYRVQVGRRILVIAAISEKDALAGAVKTVAGITVNDGLAVTVTDLGTTIELIPAPGIGRGFTMRWHPAPPAFPDAKERNRTNLDLAIVAALKKNPNTSPKTVAKRFGASVVTVRRIAVRYKLHINGAVQPRSADVTD